MGSGSSGLWALAFFWTLVEEDVLAFSCAMFTPLPAVGGRSRSSSSGASSSSRHGDLPLPCRQRRGVVELRAIFAPLPAVGGWSRSFSSAASSSSRHGDLPLPCCQLRGVVELSRVGNILYSFDISRGQAASGVRAGLCQLEGYFRGRHGAGYRIGLLNVSVFIALVVLLVLYIDVISAASLLRSASASGWRRGVGFEFLLLLELRMTSL